MKRRCKGVLQAWGCHLGGIPFSWKGGMKNICGPEDIHLKFAARMESAHIWVLVLRFKLQRTIPAKFIVCLLAVFKKTKYTI